MIIYGKNTCIEIFKNNENIKKVYLQKSVDEKFKNLVQGFYKNVFLVEKDFLNKITKFKNHQGIAIEIEEFKYSSLEDILHEHKKKNSYAFILVLDNIEDPQNLGSLIRSGVCCDVDGIVIQKNRSVGVNDTVFKIASGATSYVKICEVGNINQAIKQIKENNIFVYGLEAGEKLIYDENFSYHTCLVVGSEGKGISKLTKSLCDEIVSIPINNKINSLNASVAGAIAMFEVKRQRMLK